MSSFRPALISLLIPFGLAFAEKAPDFSLMDIDGKRFKLSEALKDGPVLIDFWATWCKPCLQELPYVNEIHNSFRSGGLQTAAITIDSPKSQAKVRPFIKGADYKFRVLLDPDMEVRKLFGGKDIPLTLLIDQKGELIYRHLGFIPGDEKKLREHVEKLFPGSKEEAQGSTELNLSN